MNKADIITKVHEELGITKADAEKAVDLVFDTIQNTMANGQRVSIAKFGIFDAPWHEAREARNPRTNEKVPVPAGRRPRLKWSQSLKAAIK